MSPLAIVTTSWDDGNPSDLRVAELLLRRGLRGTFYVPLNGYKGDRALNRAEMRSLSEAGLEIGAHGVTHRTLSTLPPREIAREVEVSKKELEDALGEEVQMFCYPRGRYNAEVVRCLMRAGYLSARTTRMLAHGLRFSPFRMPTTLQVYPHTKLAYLRNLVRARSVTGLLEYLAQYCQLGDWVALGKGLFDVVLQNGGIWHLYGHSWEIERLGLWEDLRILLDYVGGRKGVLYASNGGALNHLHRDTPLHRRSKENRETPLSS